MMKVKALKLLSLVALFNLCGAPPVTKDKKESNEEGEHPSDALQYMEYHHYLREVVDALESDPEFRKKLEDAKEEDIKSGKIAHELEFVSHNVRSKLDEIKRVELDRLREAIQKKNEIDTNMVGDDSAHAHLDHVNQHTFEIADLKKLIAKTTEDLADLDRKRRDEFKQYEMQKEFEKQDKLNHTIGDEKEKLEKYYEDLETKHKKHEPLHQPGHKAQLEQVWEEQDHMQQEFQPKPFFMMHDLDSNGLWDQEEVKALFVKELDKMYENGAPEDDLRERAEEMERMREYVFNEVDGNRDGFIDFNEFVEQTKRQQFQQDDGWKGLDEQRPYTDEELNAYMEQQANLHREPPPPYHPGQAPPPYYHPEQIPPGGYHPGQAPPSGYQQGQGPPPQYHPNQIPQGQPQHQFQYQGQQYQPPPNSGQYPNVAANQQPPPYPGGHHQFQYQAGNPPLNTNEVYQQPPNNQPPNPPQNQQYVNPPAAQPHIQSQPQAAGQAQQPAQPQVQTGGQQPQAQQGVQQPQAQQGGQQPQARSPEQPQPQLHSPGQPGQPV